MTRILVSDWGKKRMKDPAFRREYEALEEEFALLNAMLSARGHAGLTQAQVAKRMKTTQTAVARLESGRAKPSTRTLERFARATGHRLVIGFEPIKRTIPKAGGQSVAHRSKDKPSRRQA